MTRKRVAILISGRGSNMAALIAAAQDKDYPAEIVLIASNRAEAEGLVRARETGITTEVVDHKRFGKEREAFDRVLYAVLQAHRVEIVCLAGFMRVLTPWFVERWPGRLINIHPSLLPAFKGLDTHARALRAGATQHGATVHYVVPELDSGPIIAQESIAINPGDTADTLAARVLEIEHRIYPLALKRVAEADNKSARVNW
jgi:phosphoribosylglycinamide formyltransferase-1